VLGVLVLLLFCLAEVVIGSLAASDMAVWGVVEEGM
jgi:hypothetical protein